MEKKNTIGTEYYLYEKLGKMESDLEYQVKAIDELKKDMNSRFGEVNKKFDKKFDTLYTVIGLGFAILGTMITIFNFI